MCVRSRVRGFSQVVATLPRRFQSIFFFFMPFLCGGGSKQGGTATKDMQLTAIYKQQHESRQRIFAFLAEMCVVDVCRSPGEDKGNFSVASGGWRAREHGTVVTKYTGKHTWASIFDRYSKRVQVIVESQTKFLTSTRVWESIVECIVIATRKFLPSHHCYEQFVPPLHCSRGPGAVVPISHHASTCSLSRCGPWLRQAKFRSMVVTHSGCCRTEATFLASNVDASQSARERTRVQRTYPVCPSTLESTPRHPRGTPRTHQLPTTNRHQHRKCGNGCGTDSFKSLL